MSKSENLKFPSQLSTYLPHLFKFLLLYTNLESFKTLPQLKKPVHLSLFF